MRYLVVTVDSAGALYPQLALAQRLQARGHQIRFLACRSQRRSIETAGFAVHTYSGEPDFDMADPEGPIRDWRDDPGTAFKACCDVIWFGPAAAIAADVIELVRQDPADVLVIDYFAFGAALAAERLGLPSVILWHTLFGEWDVFNAGLPALNAARAGLGLPEVDDVYEAYHRAERILALTTEAFHYAAGDTPVPSNLRYVGPQFAPGQEPRSIPPLTPRTPFVLVALSTSYQAQEDLLLRVIGALAELPVRALVTTGPAVRLDVTPPAHVEVRRWVSHAEVLPQADLVVTHAGLGTVMTSMAFGVPLLCLPMGRDQHGNAEAVAKLGFGRIADRDAGVAELRNSIAAVLADTEVRARARRLAEECLRDGFDTGAVELEAVATTRSLPG